MSGLVDGNGRKESEENMNGKWKRDGYEPSVSQQEIDDITESIERLNDLITRQAELTRDLAGMIEECLGRVDSVETSLGWWEARK